MSKRILMNVLWWKKIDTQMFGSVAPHKIKLQHALQSYWYILTCAAWIASFSPIHLSFEKYFKNLNENWCVRLNFIGILCCYSCLFNIEKHFRWAIDNRWLLNYMRRLSDIVWGEKKTFRMQTQILRKGLCTLKFTLQLH